MQQLQLTMMLGSSCFSCQVKLFMCAQGLQQQAHACNHLVDRHSAAAVIKSALPVPMQLLLVSLAGAGVEQAWWQRGDLAAGFGFAGHTTVHGEAWSICGRPLTIYFADLLIALKFFLAGQHVSKKQGSQRTVVWYTSLHVELGSRCWKLEGCTFALAK